VERQVTSYRDGLCFPSYETIAEKARCCQRTVYEAIMALEDTGVFSWVNRIDRVADRVKKRSRRSTVPCQKN
jgi:predicted transcriptional regulator YheO